MRRTGGVPAAMMPSSRPQRESWSTPPRISAWVESVSEPARALVEEQRPQPAPGEQHGGGGAGRPGADDDDVVEVAGLQGRR